MGNRTKRQQAKARVVAFAMLGALVGAAVLPRPAGALSCGDPAWSLDLSSLEESDPSQSHSTYWPSSAYLERIGDCVWFFAEGSGEPDGVTYFRGCE